ncbi:pullulanase [Natronospora cellulosivora (SeqCode)]
MLNKRSLLMIVLCISMILLLSVLIFSIDDSNEVLFQAFYWEIGDMGDSEAQDLWKLLAERAVEFADAGFTAIWMPPAHKAWQGVHDIGYGVYDIWDLGEFKQPADPNYTTVRTRYGTRKELEEALSALKDAGLSVYYDVIFNHRIGADRTERIRLSSDSPNLAGEEIEAWTYFEFDGRQVYYSRANEFMWDHNVFDSVDYDDSRNQNGIFLFENKEWDNTYGIPYLMGANVHYQNEDVVHEMKEWGRWILSDIGFDGFRLDASKHIDSTFIDSWVNNLQDSSDSDIFFVAEAWEGDLDSLIGYVHHLNNDQVNFFDFPLRSAFEEMRDGRLDMRELGERGLLNHPDYGDRAVSFVDNHDTDRESNEYVRAIDNRKLQAYSYILMHEKGLPTIYWRDYYLADMKDALDDLIAARRRFAYGPGRVAENTTKDTFAYLREGSDMIEDSGLVLLLSMGENERRNEETEVLFTYQAGIDLSSVHLAGTFNNWSSDSTEMLEVEDRVYQVTLSLPPGRYEYKFVIDGFRWIRPRDAENYTDDGFGGQNAVINVLESNEEISDSNFLNYIEQVDDSEQEARKNLISMEINSTQANTVFFDYTGNVEGTVETDSKGIGEFKVRNSSEKGWSVWVPLSAKDLEGDNTVSTAKDSEIPENHVRVHYKHDQDTYEEWGLWIWGDVVKPSEAIASWPDGAYPFSDKNIGYAGAYIDIEVEENARQINFLAVNMETTEQTADMNVPNIRNNQLFFRRGDDEVYTNPYYLTEDGIRTGELLSESIELRFTSTDSLTKEDLFNIKVKNKEGSEITIEELFIIDGELVILKGDFDPGLAPYTLRYKEDTIEVNAGWRLIDDLYAYDGKLGAELLEDGSARLKLWSPGADNVLVVLYDKEDQYQIVADNIAMTLGDKGVWQVFLNEENTGIDDLGAYFYHYKIERDGDIKLALDPYAKSMASWNSDPDDSEKTYPVGKAAIVDPSNIGPELDYAEIEGFENRVDAIIYEIHVRDFTSDPKIADDLNSQFATFEAFVDKLDYIEELGVTHIQLLPVMSYFWGDELANDQRMLEYSSSGNNYNWGYDPHSYFSLSGMYSENPEDPELRIKEFKKLIDEIHSRGMGVILDVVYNHTARVTIFEDLLANYYHFMDADGSTRTSFGGGRLGTTHHMSRRILLDSITYWVEEFKLDGFRFDMMGDHDAETIQMAYDKAKELNPKIIMLGEGWRTFVGDENAGDIMPADQDWMQYTDSVGVFSDEFRNELKSGFGNEGQPRFITGGARNIEQIFDNLKAQAHNFKTTDPGDVVQYIAAHDNLSLHDVIAVSIQKDPDYHQEEIQKRIRLGNTMLLTAQGTAFIHAGQEYGRTKQFRAETDEAPYKSHKGIDENGEPFTYPYFIHDSYDSTDIINKFDWSKVRGEGIHRETMKYTKGLIELRRSTDAFRLSNFDLINSNVSLITSDDIRSIDLLIAYRAESSGGEAYYVFINADDKQRAISLDFDLRNAEVIVDAKEAGIEPIRKPSGFELYSDSIILDGLTAVILRSN